ncbi:hypothetical protein [Aestuariivirga sp.]|uniref:hypothetical protein n=1 Tax=Aestuariivirga sp. TaxID=2650926 RepID=UPI00359481FC
MTAMNAIDLNLHRAEAHGGTRSGMHVRPLMAGGQRAATVLLSSSQCPAQAHSDTLQPSVSITYDRHAIDSNSGTFSVRISLHNKSAHVAHEPFLCLPIFGLELSPAVGWTMQDISSIRRLRRFGPGRGEDLAPGSSVHCCNISLLFNALDGGQVEFDAGSWHPVHDLPDLRLTCVAGAGNFPSERLPLVVPAVTLTGFLAQLMVMGEVPQGLIPQA